MSNILTPVFRVSYPNLFKAKKNDLNGKDEYSVVALFPKMTDFSKLKAAGQELIEAKWGKGKKLPPLFKSPFRNQSDRAKEDEVTGKLILPEGYEEGGIFINFKTQQRPGIVDQNVQDIVDSSEIYAGCYCRATVRPYVFDIKGSCGLAFGLQNIQKIKDGDPISGRTKAQDDFAPVGQDMGATQSANDIFG